MSGAEEIRPVILVPFGHYAGTPLRDLPDAYLATLTDSDSHAHAFAERCFPTFLRAAHREWHRRGWAISVARGLAEVVECAHCNNTTEDPVPASRHACGLTICRPCYPTHVCREPRE